MPSLPTSLIVVGLVAAWLVVLVPMVAKRREHVPDSDDEGVGFRVLRRASRSMRRRVMSRTAVSENAVGAVDEVGDELEDEFEGGDGFHGGDGFDSTDELEDAGGFDGRAEVRDRAEFEDGDESEDAADDRRAVLSDDGRDHGDRDEHDEADGVRRFDERGSWDEHGEVDTVTAPAEGFDEFGDVADGATTDGAARYGQRSDSGERVLRRAPGRSGRRSADRPRRAPVAAYQRAEYGTDDDAAEEAGGYRHRPADSHQTGGGDRGFRDPRSRSARDHGDPERGDYRERDDSSGEWQDEAQLRPVPVRPGRGGFDPRAAEQAKAYRYRQRRRVAVVLLALAVAGAALGVLGVSLAWAGAVCSFVLLALYLAYLRRQVRIEESIRQRRASRLERARQIRPVYRATVAEQVRAHRSGSLPRPAAGYQDEGDAPYRVTSHARPASSVPPTYYTRGVPVDLDDDDPAFDDLEYYRPAAYRRAVGE